MIEPCTRKRNTMEGTQQKLQECTAEKEKALLLLEGDHSTKEDACTAVAMLDRLAKEGDSDAMWILGVCHEYGMGVAQDVKAADQLYTKSAQKRNPTAKLLVGKLYDWKARSCYTDLDLGCTQEKKQANNANRDL